MPQRAASLIATLCMAGLGWSQPANAQSLEETVLTLYRVGAQSEITKREPGLVLTGGTDSLEIRVVDQERCVVRITDKDRKPTTTLKVDWGGKDVIERPNTDATHEEFFFDRVLTAEITEIPAVEASSTGGVTRQSAEAKWLLPGNDGDELRCVYWPDGRKTCSNKIEFDRTLPSTLRHLPDYEARAWRVDQAVAHLYVHLCKGTNRIIASP